MGASNGLFYELVVDANDVGSTLSTTETAGTYKLNDAGPCTAVAYDANGTEKARSENGYLTVPTAGAYTVRWEETPTCSATMTAHAAQIRGDGGLRFISTIDGINATRNADGTANYSAATIAVNGVTYKVTTVGTVFARKTKLGSAELVLGLSGVSYDIPAVKLQNPANAPTGITMKDGTILFTGVIVNIPQTSYSETLVARAYVAYDDGGVIKYVYADPIERSYQGILESLE